MLFINKAYAQAADSLSKLEGEIPALPEPESATSVLMSNLMVLGVIMGLFYLLLIRPQQKRIQQHVDMLKELKKGDMVVTGGGLVGKVDKLYDDKDEVIIDLGDIKVTALRSSISRKEDDPRLKSAAANDKGDKKKDVVAAKSEKAEKTTVKKKTAAKKATAKDAKK